MRCLLLICLLFLAPPLAFGSPQAQTAASPVTSYAQMTAQLRADAARSPLLRLVSLGKSAKGQKDLWLVRVADPGADPAQTTRLLVLCRQHGDEPASTEAVLRLIHQIARGGDPVLANALPKATLYLVPMVNPDGADANTRANGVGADLNRDWGLFSQPETRLMARAAALIQPHIILDAHNWDGGDHYNANCLEIARAMMTPQGKWLHALQSESVAHLARSGYALHPTAYGPEIDPHLAHRYFASQGLLAALVETHSGDPHDRADFQGRQGLYLALIHGLVQREAARAAKDKPALDRLEGYTRRQWQEARLFPPLPVSSAAPRRVGLFRLRRSVPASIWVLCLYGFALWAGSLSRRKQADTGLAAKGWAGREICYVTTRSGIRPVCSLRPAPRRADPQTLAGRATCPAAIVRRADATNAAELSAARSSGRVGRPAHLAACPASRAGGRSGLRSRAAGGVSRG